jgi:protease IV
MVVVFLFAGVGLMVVAGFFALSSQLRSIDAEAKPVLPSQIQLSMALTEGMPETRLGSGIAGLFKKVPTITEFVQALDAAAKDERVTGLVMRIEPVPMSMAQVQEMRSAIKRFRAAGKRAEAFSFSLGDFAGGTAPYYLASAFDQIWLQPVGSVAINGMSIESPFVADLMKRYHVKFQAIAREEYKSAMAMYTDSDMSDAQREAMDQLLGDIYDQLVEDIAADRNLTPESVRALIDNAPLTAEEALEGGLIDHIGYRDEFLAAQKGEPVSLYAYSRQLEQPVANRNGIGLIHASGPIVQGADGDASALGVTMPIQRINDALEQAIEDPDILAVVIRLDSPGGSPAASEFVRRAIARLSESGKPVVISMASVAASGGYWIASGADALVAEPGTITGSIGVISGKPDLSEFWKEWDVNWARIQRGENADISTINKPFDEKGLATANRQIDDIYHNFLERVAESRGFSVEEARALAKGRVWSGRQAFQIGLVDELGGIDTAFAKATAAAGKKEGETVLVEYPRAASRLETAFRLISELGGVWEGLKMMSQLASVAERTGVNATLKALEAPNASQVPAIELR